CPSRKCRSPASQMGSIQKPGWRRSSPKFRLGQVFLPHTEVLAIKRGELRRHPGFCMDPICDAGDRHFLDGHAGPDIFPKRSGDFAMQFAYPVGVPAKTQRQDGHTEGIVWIEAGLTEREQLVERNV